MISSSFCEPFIWETYLNNRFKNFLELICFSLAQWNPDLFFCKDQNFQNSWFLDYRTPGSIIYWFKFTKIFQKYRKTMVYFSKHYFFISQHSGFLFFVNISESRNYLPRRDLLLSEICSEHVLKLLFGLFQNYSKTTPKLL